MDDISNLKESYLSLIEASSSEGEVEKIRLDALGKKGEITTRMRELGTMPSDKRRVMGPILNDLKESINQAIGVRKDELLRVTLDNRLKSEWLDISRPARETYEGTIHPISQVTEEVITIFADLGFEVADGPQIESDYYNFDALNIPLDHPARQEFDTFYISGDSDENKPLNVLRTHTSPVQIRHMEKVKGPCKIIAPGRVFRSDYDQTHTPMFHQVEGLAVGKSVSMGNLKWVLEEFCRAFFEVNSIELRFRSSHFPFTEPSAEVDIRCSWVENQLKIGEGSDWMEILGSGMVHPNVLNAVGIDPEVYQGFAFGLGIDRIAMLKYGIPDLRTFFDSDIRWLKHFGFSVGDFPSIHAGISR
ncbi:MAG: phenylalanine--tRNA ligase subunit alpha [Pseudomonadota bacterium]|nr:phenylalanine--tRNA ligase subunit alpha [Pseudomonadota bacterium]